VSIDSGAYLARLLKAWRCSFKLLLPSVSFMNYVCFMNSFKPGCTCNTPGVILPPNALASHEYSLIISISSCCLSLSKWNMLVPLCFFVL
jgi:hypothetical protein